MTSGCGRMPGWRDPSSSRRRCARHSTIPRSPWGTSRRRAGTSSTPWACRSPSTGRAQQACCSAGSRSACCSRPSQAHVAGSASRRGRRVCVARGDGAASPRARPCAPRCRVEPGAAPASRVRGAPACRERPARRRTAAAGLDGDVAAPRPASSARRDDRSRRAARRGRRRARDRGRRAPSARPRAATVESRRRTRLRAARAHQQGAAPGRSRRARGGSAGRRLDDRVLRRERGHRERDQALRRGPVVARGRPDRRRPAGAGGGQRPGRSRPQCGLGLPGLTDRVAALGGSLVVHSPPGRGTVLEAVLPCAS